jgi:cell division protein FtsW (lipid II flippase)
VDAQTGLTFLVTALSFGGVQLAVMRFAPMATALLLPPAALLAGIGFTEIYRLNPYRAGLQRWWLAIAAGLAVGLLVLLADRGLDLVRRYRYLFLSTGLLLLLAPRLPQDWAFPLRGLELNGSRLWLVLDLGPSAIHFQPGEVAKLSLIAFLASYLAERQPALVGAGRRFGRIRIPALRQLTPVLLVTASGILVLVSQRDLGASLLMFGVMVGMLYSATGGALYPLGGLMVAGVGGYLAWRTFPHVDRRVTAWLRPFSDFDGAGYQVVQGWFALGSGSLSGAGLGLGRPDLIPNASTDFMFAAVGEELGFAGLTAVLGLYALITAAAFGVALRARDRFRKLLASGLAFGFFLQVFLIAGGILRLVPLTGLALPLMSYGGSSLVGTFLLLALLLRISHEEAA